MKIFFNFFLMALLGFSTYAQQTPWISKQVKNGASLSGARVKTCQLFSDSFYVSYAFGNDPGAYYLSESRPTRLIGDIENLIRRARRNPLNSQPNPLLDGSLVETKAYLGETVVLLQSRGGTGFPIQFRSGEESQILLDMMNTYCPD